MNEEMEIVKKLLSEMAEILNAVPGERFELKCAQTLLIVQRRMEHSDMQAQLSIYTHLFSKEELPSMTELSNAAVSYVKIKTLCETEMMEFDPISTRALVKEFHAHKTKVLNIIHLSKVNALTAEDFQKEIINKTLQKSQMYLNAFEDEIKRAERKIEKEPESLIKQKVEEVVKPEETVKSVKKKRVSFSKIVDKVSSIAEGIQHRKEITSYLKEMESKLADSRCEEIPFYDKQLKYTESHVCKDIPAFSVFLRKGNVYFGKTQNVTAGVYDNGDESLFELMNVSSDFIQFLTTDLLCGEYELKPFEDYEKKAMQLYFNFICMCFEKHIGKLLTVQEYLHFKDYYNRLVLTMLDLESKEKSAYYQALSFADQYLAYMDGYDLTVADSKDEIIKNIIAEKNLNYIGDLDLILENHVVCAMAREALSELKENIRYFHGKSETEVNDLKLPEDVSIDFQGAKIVIEILSETGMVLDEALFLAENLEIAVSDYLTKEAVRKRIGIEKDGIRTYLFSGRMGGMSIPIITNEMRSAWSEEENRYFTSIEEKLYTTMIRIGGYTL